MQPERKRARVGYKRIAYNGRQKANLATLELHFLTETQSRNMEACESG